MLQGEHVRIEISGPLIVVWLMPAVGMLLVLIAMRNVTPKRYHRVITSLRWMLLAYLCGAVALTLYPYTIDPSAAGLENGNWSPLQGTIGFFLSDNPARNAVATRDVVANVAMMSPFGLLVPFAFYQWRGIPVPALFIAFLTFGLELTQGILVADRTFDIDDAIAGFIGAVLALLVAAVLRPVVHRRA